MRTAQIIRALSVATVVAVWGAAVAGAGKADGAVAAGAVQAGAAQPASTPDRALLDRYCVTCHNARLKTAGLTLDDIDVANVGPRAEAWEKVLRKIRAGQMPPVGRPRPDAAAASAFMGALETALERASSAAPNPGRPTMHRLNRTEYSNSVRDLLALEIDGRSLLPADDTDEHGFDNNADVLTVSPVLAARYLSAARKIGRLAVGRSTATTIETYRLPRQLVQDDRLDERLPFGSRGGTVIDHYFPADGEYVVKIRLQTNNYNYIKGLADAHELEVRLDRAKVKVFTVGGMKEGAAPASWGGTLYGSPDWERYLLQMHDDLEVRLPVKAGQHEVGIAFVRKSWEADEVAQPRQGGWPLSSDEMFDSNPGVDTVIVEGPHVPAGPGDTPSRRRIFTCQPRAAGARGDNDACAKNHPLDCRSSRLPPAADGSRRPDPDGVLPARQPRRRVRGRHSARARTDPRQPRFSVPDRTGSLGRCGERFVPPDRRRTGEPVVILSLEQHSRR